VSDFKRYASAVDIVAGIDRGTVDIFDIKNGVFKRDYVTWQMSIYKYLIEKYARFNVRRCVAVSVKDREYYELYPLPLEKVEKLLYG
jgi:hypothetical protein